MVSGSADALTKAALTTPQGFRGTAGVFRLFLVVQRTRFGRRNNPKQSGGHPEQAPRSFGGPARFCSPRLAQHIEAPDDFTLTGASSFSTVM
jgi:hypothetical protein